MEPIVDRLEEQYSREFTIVRVDTDTVQGKQLAREQGVIGQPAYVLFDRSGEQVRRLMGAQLVETFEREIERILGQ